MGIARLEVAPELLGKVLELLPPGIKVIGSGNNEHGAVMLIIQSDHLVSGALMRLTVTTTPLSISAELKEVK